MTNEDFLTICTPETYEAIGKLAKEQEETCNKRLGYTIAKIIGEPRDPSKPIMNGLHLIGSTTKVGKSNILNRKLSISNVPCTEFLAKTSINPKALAQWKRNPNKILYMDNEGIMSTMTNIYETTSLDAEWVAYDGLELVCLNGGEITVRTNKALLYAQDGVTFEQDCWLPISQIRYFKAEEMSAVESIELKTNKEIVKFWEEKDAVTRFYLPIEKIYIPRWLAEDKFGKEEILKLGDKSLFKKIESFGEDFFDDLDI